MRSWSLWSAVAALVVLSRSELVAETRISSVIRPALTLATYLGGGQSDTAAGVAVDALGNILIAGTTASTNFPNSGSGEHPRSSGTDIVVVKIAPDGSRLLYSKRLGGTGEDTAMGIAVDSAGNAYVIGWTTSTNFPTVRPLQATNAGGVDAVVAKLDSNGNVAYATYLGGSGDEPFAPNSFESLPSFQGNPIAVDAAGNVYLTGMSSSTNFPVAHAMQPGLDVSLLKTYGIDAFVTKISATGDALLYSTYLGGRDSTLGMALPSTRKDTLTLPVQQLASSPPGMLFIHPIKEDRWTRFSAS